ncbi:nucleotidyltransferase family protein [Enterobacteriaceae bacterium 89]|nr:nucleotidyltransferase family protein [Enterobacteriaceae bacterium 89]
MVTGIIIAAAGCGARFTQAGGKGNKLNADLHADTLFSATLTQALASGLPVHVVTRPDNAGVQKVCQRRHVAYTLLDSPGLGHSIAAGVAATPEWAGWLIHLADMPYVEADVFCRVATALSEHDVARPCYQHAPGHPVGFSHLLRDGLLALEGDEGARSLLAQYPAFRLETRCAGVIQDIDLPSQLPAGEH